MHCLLIEAPVTCWRAAIQTAGGCMGAQAGVLRSAVRDEVGYRIQQLAADNAKLWLFAVTQHQNAIASAQALQARPCSRANAHFVVADSQALQHAHPQPSGLVAAHEVHLGWIAIRCEIGAVSCVLSVSTRAGDHAQRQHGIGRHRCLHQVSLRGGHHRSMPSTSQVAQLQLEVRSLRAAVTAAEAAKPRTAVRVLLTSVTTAAAAVLAGVLVMAVLPGTSMRRSKSHRRMRQGWAPSQALINIRHCNSGCCK